MQKKSPPHNLKQQIKYTLKFSLWFFVGISTVAVLYEAFREDIGPVLKENVPLVYETLEQGRAEHLDMMENKGVKK